MADTLTRTRQRRSPQGDLARAAWLTQRLRAGELTPTRLRLAAQVGDPAARLLTGEVERARPLPGWRDRTWKRAFRAAGRAPLVFLAWRAGRDALAIGQTWSRASRHLGRPRHRDLRHLERALAAAAAWLQRPSRGRQRALAAFRRAEATWDPVAGDLASQQTRWLTVRLVDAVLDWPADAAVRDVLAARTLLDLWARQSTRQRFDRETAPALCAWLLEGQADWTLPTPPRAVPVEPGVVSRRGEEAEACGADLSQGGDLAQPADHSQTDDTVTASSHVPVVVIGAAGLTVCLASAVLGSVNGFAFGVGFLATWLWEWRAAG